MLCISTRSARNVTCDTSFSSYAGCLKLTGPKQYTLIMFSYFEWTDLQATAIWLGILMRHTACTASGRLFTEPLSEKLNSHWELLKPKNYYVRNFYPWHINGITNVPLAAGESFIISGPDKTFIVIDGAPISVLIHVLLNQFPNSIWNIFFG